PRAGVSLGRSPGSGPRPSSRGRTQLIPFPKSAAVATRSSALTGSPATTVARAPRGRHIRAVDPADATVIAAPMATRKDLPLGRPVVSLAHVVTIASAYAVLFTHQQLVHFFGTIACLVYILDRIRIHYPEVAGRVPLLNRLFFRAEEQFKESAMTPYA